MARKRKVENAVPPGLSIRVEDGTTVAVLSDMTGQRGVTVGGQSYEVCRVDPDGVWVYRAMAF